MWRPHYWSCSTFADRLRGTPKPAAATLREWKRWERAARQAHPLRYWLAEKGLNRLQDLVNAPRDLLDRIISYISNRWIDHTHGLTAHPENLRPGQWYDIDHRILHALFDTLVDHVEIDLARRNVIFDDAAADRYGRAPGKLASLLHRKAWRSPEAGLAHLDWEAGLVFKTCDGLAEDDPRIGHPTPQAISARQIREIYLWYKKTRPARPDPFKETGLVDYYASCRARGLDPLEDDPECDRHGLEEMSRRRAEIEARHDAEDEDMLIRLIRLRRSLWT